MADFLENIKLTLQKPTAERLYCSQLKGIVEPLPLEGILVGDKTTAIELYFIDWVKTYGETQELTYKNGDFILQLFHEIALEHPTGIEQPSFDELLQAAVDAFRYEATKLDFMKEETYSDGNYLWTSRPSNLYILLKDITSTSISGHCQHCANMVKRLEASFNYNMLILLSFLSNHTLLEEFYAHLFENLFTSYWNVDVMAATFKTCICKHLVQKHLHTLDQQQDVFNGVNFKFLLLWATQPSLHVHLKMPFAPLVQRILARLQLVGYEIKILLLQDTYNLISKQNSNGSGVKPNEVSYSYKCCFPLVLKSLEYMTAHMENKYISKSPNTSAFYKCGFKQMHRACLEPHLVLRLLLEQLAYIEQVMLEVDANYAMQQPYVFGSDKSPLEIPWIYNDLVFADFNGTNVHKCRCVVLTMYAIALYHQRSYMRVDDLTYLPMLHALPWMPAIDFISQDVVLHYISASFIKATVQCLGDGYLINFLGTDTLTSLFANACAQDDFCIENETLTCQMFRHSVTILNANIIRNIITRGKQQTVASLTGFVKDSTAPNCKAHYASIWHVLTGIVEAEASPLEDTSLNENTSTFTPTETHWILYYLVSICRENPSIVCRTMLEFLIVKYIMRDDDIAQAADFNTNTMFTSHNGGTSDVYNTLKSKLDSNYIALHQNPINLLLRVPKSHLLKLLQLRIFYNILLLLLDKMNKYIYVGCSNLLLNGDAQVYQVCALQQIGMINILLQVAANSPSPQVVRYLKGFVSSILYENGFATQMLLSVGIPMDCDYGLIQCCSSCLTFANAVACYESAIKALVCDNGPKRCWSKDDVSIPTTNNEIARSLEPMDAADFVVYSFYLILLTCETQEHGESTQVEGPFDWNACIKAIVSSFYECVEKLQPSPLATLLVDKALNVLVKLHFLYPSIGNVSSVFIKEFLQSGCEGIDAISARLKSAGQLLDVIFEEGAAKM